MLNEQQIQMLIHLVASATADSMDCDGCFGEIARFAEVELAGKSLPEAMRRVQIHLVNCPCCQKEYALLMDALRGMQNGGQTTGTVS